MHTGLVFTAFLMAGGLAMGCGGAAPPANAPQAPASSAQAAPAASAADNGALPPPTAPEGAKQPVTVTPPAAAGNLFADAVFYIDPAYVAKVESSIKTHAADAALLKKVEAFPTAVWLDSIKAAATVGKTLDSAAAQEKKAGKPVVTVFAVYDLPERDCSAAASNGELTAAKDGEKRYQKEFIDKIAAQIKAHPKQRVIAVVEPDSLPNIATNAGVPKCAAAEGVYKHSIAYAIKTLALPNVALYLDAAHAGWLGWSGNRAKIAKLFSDVLTEAGGPDKIRGFATNVSNYDALKDGDLPKLEPSDPATCELSYVQLLDESLTEAGIVGKAFVVDTSRNGRTGIRTKSGSWCNIKGAGLGERPQASPTPLVDAYFWIKPPGDSDGGSEAAEPGYDKSCGGPDAPDSASHAPHAGVWFSDYFVDLAKNAQPPL
ncbi:MAG: glycoside hydrolase family 6 protein [Polyangiaceae bacterium]|nr:glycoside hydrolase family 6 protein [Polyangiaceae bacterium]